jgi:hypothetical protein
MISHIPFKKIAVVVGAGSAIALSSCTLPPEQAWRKIRSEGLIAYWSFEMGSQHAEAHLKHRMPSTIIAPTSVPAPSMLARTRVVPTTPGPIGSGGRTLTALNIPALPGFVRSPYTSPPRLVDVKGATPGSTMICPYTQRPFIVPSDFRSTPNTMIATTPPLAPTGPSIGPTGPSISTTGPTAPPRSTSENLPKVTLNDRPTQPVAPPPQVQPKPEPKTKPAPAPSSVASNKPTAPPLTAPTTPPAAENKPVQDIPFGSAIAGRPGFVNSPFAAKHQLVDVTGLPTGMEVKCPYTGKLFRVPPQEMASSKSVEGPPLASPQDEQPKKK